MDNRKLALDPWPLADDGSEVLARELADEFGVERALLPSGVTERVMQALPREVTPLVRFARMLTGAVVVAAVGCLALAVGLLAEGGAPGRGLQLVAGLGAMTVGLLLNFAAPRLVLLDARIVERISGRWVLPDISDVVLVRAGALLILAAGGFLMLP